MFIFYVDESGSSVPHCEPLLNGQTPLFIVASLSFKTSHWRSLDRSYLALKKKFFSKEIGTRRAETYEVKGNELVSPRNHASSRRHAFLSSTLNLCKHYDAQGFAVIIRKNPIHPTPKNSLYNMAMQYSVERFGYFLDETSEGLTEPYPALDAHGIIIADSRMKNLDLNVAISHLSFAFGHPMGLQCKRMVEAPTFTFSQLSAGVQLTDIFAAARYAQYYRRLCSTIPNAVDYSHTAFVDDSLRDLQWQARRAHNGYIGRGYRVIDHSVGG